MSRLQHLGDRRAGVSQGLTVTIAGFLPMIAVVSMFPAVPSIIDHFQGDPTASWKVPWMVTAPGLAIAVIAPFAGALIDRFGRRAMVVWSTLFYAIAGTAPFLLTDLDAMFLSRLALGIAEAAILTTVNTLIADYWDEGGRRHWLSIQGMVGPFVGSALILGAGYLTAMRWNGVFLIYLAAFPIFLAMLAFVFEPAVDTSHAAVGEAPRDKPAFPAKKIALIGAVTLLSSIIYYVYAVNGGLAFREVGIRSSDELGRITFLPSLGVSLGAGIFWLVGKRRSEVAFVLLLALVGTGLCLIGVAPDWKWMAAGVVFQQTGVGMMIPTLITWAQRDLPPAHRGRGMGVWTGCFFLGQFLSPPIVTLVQSATGSMQATFAAAGLAAFAGMLVAIAALLRRENPGGAAIPAT